MKMQNISARDFAEQMIPHHEIAVQMATAYLDGSGEKSPEITKLAENIVITQTAEIKKLRVFLAR